jgi:hypothetical protein
MKKERDDNLMEIDDEESDEDDNDDDNHNNDNDDNDNDNNNDDDCGDDDADPDDEKEARKEKQREDCRLDDAGPDNSPESLSSIYLASKPGVFVFFFCSIVALLLSHLTEQRYPKDRMKLSQYIHEPGFPLAFKSFLYSMCHPNCPAPENIEMHISFTGKIHVFHSAISCFYSPSDLCGPSGMYRQHIRSTPSWYGHP